ncbi:uncharacterized protein LOC135826269 [Sycon ciliatum]|uniref:uncharacterized protein LOC135826269 n=1 Tax=Sycon ciliatum TaxID=27933 RepID=UPI0031F63612
MGNHLAPPLAILFMDALEQKALSTATVKPDLYKRYIDDCILLWRHGWKGLTALLDHFNGQHTTIKFTMEHSVNETQSVNFLDLALSVRGNSIEWELYVKPSHNGVHLSYESCLPWSCKRAVATNQFSRAIRNSSTPEAEDRSMSIIEELLERNDYPRTEINAARRAAKRKRQDTHPSQQQQRDSKRRHNQFKSVIKLPFINDSLAARVSRRVRKFSPHVRVVFVSGPSLKDMLVRSSSAVRVCPREKQRSEVKRGRGRPMECRACDASMVDSQCLVKGVVYCMSCTLCAELYVGETERPVRDRFAEHYREARAMVAKAPWGFHYRTQHRESLKSSNFLPFHQAKILGREASLPSRKLLEAIEIRKRKPAVNCDDG